jgi:outer membrane protein assembly factor BamD (BamD/ComL family)
MKSIIFLSTLSFFFLFSCGESAEHKSKKENLREGITAYEDSLANLQKDPQKAAKITSLAQIELINRLKTYTKAFPKDTFSADCLFKIHMIYEHLRAPREARAYGDTLLERFPDYKNRLLVIESLGSSYDINAPRDTAMVRKYYNLLLQEPKIPTQKKKDIKARLAKLDLTFEEYILKSQAGFLVGQGN